MFLQYMDKFKRLWVFVLHNSLSTGQTNYEVMIMKKEEEKAKAQENAKKTDNRPETFQNHWETGKFLGPNTLRYEENRKQYENEE